MSLALQNIKNILDGQLRNTITCTLTTQLAGQKVQSLNIVTVLSTTMFYMETLLHEMVRCVTVYDTANTRMLCGTQ